MTDLLPARTWPSAVLLLALLLFPLSTHAQQSVSNPAFNDPAGPDGVIGTADDDYRPSKPDGSDLIDAGQTGVGLADALDIDGDGNTSEPIPGPFATVDRDNGSAPDLGVAESSGEALPVELVALDARLQSDGASEAVVLSWRTASETGNAGFAVERRTAAKGTWTKVGRVGGAGTTTRPQRYRFSDDEIPFAAERLTYRLRQIDTDGSATLSDSVTVTRSGTARLTLRAPAPNPAHTETTIQVALPENLDGPATLRVYDLMGRQLQTHSLDASDPRQSVRIDATSLTSGPYLIRLHGPSGATRSRRFTVVR